MDCKYCGKQAGQGVMRCPHCGGWQPPYVAPAETVVPLQAEGKQQPLWTPPADTEGAAEGPVEVQYTVVPSTVAQASTVAPTEAIADIAPTVQVPAAMVPPQPVASTYPAYMPALQEAAPPAAAAPAEAGPEYPTAASYVATVLPGLLPVIGLFLCLLWAYGGTRPQKQNLARALLWIHGLLLFLLVIGLAVWVLVLVSRL